MCRLSTSPAYGVTVKRKSHRKLTEMYQYQLDHVEAFYNSGSDMDFFAHATMHGYMLTKENAGLTARKD